MTHAILAALDTLLGCLGAILGIVFLLDRVVARWES